MTKLSIQQLVSKLRAHTASLGIAQTVEPKKDKHVTFSSLPNDCDVVDRENLTDDDMDCLDESIVLITKLRDCLC